MVRAGELAPTLVESADTLVADLDGVALLTPPTDRSVQLLGVDAAGLMLVVPAGEVRVMAAASDVMRMLEPFELQALDEQLDHALSTRAVSEEATGMIAERAPRRRSPATKRHCAHGGPLPVCRSMSRWLR